MRDEEQSKDKVLGERREKARREREKRGDTPEAVAERGKRSPKARDDDFMRKIGERTGVYI